MSHVNLRSFVRGSVILSAIWVGAFSNAQGAEAPPLYSYESYTEEAKSLCYGK